MEEHLAKLKERFSKPGEYKMDQIGYPDCVHYDKGDIYVVMSWWNYTAKFEDKKYTAPMMLSHTFDKDGKIVNSSVYFSTNHFEDEE